MHHIAQPKHLNPPPSLPQRLTRQQTIVHNHTIGFDHPRHPTAHLPTNTVENNIELLIDAHRSPRPPHCHRFYAPLFQ